MYCTVLHLMLQNSRRGMKASLSAAMARVTREPAQLGLGHDTQCAWSNGAMQCQLTREVE